MDRFCIRRRKTITTHGNRWERRQRQDFKIWTVPKARRNVRQILHLRIMWTLDEKYISSSSPERSCSLKRKQPRHVGVAAGHGPLSGASSLKRYSINLTSLNWMEKTLLRGFLIEQRRPVYELHAFFCLCLLSEESFVNGKLGKRRGGVSKGPGGRKKMIPTC